ncbi:MAG TPA: SIMPL domain-containing protein [Coriobacteriia bacterium]|nr:SIMPL domain-containing protein [Coriobacteriia bacterium]
MRTTTSDIVAVVALAAVLVLALAGCTTKVVTSPGQQVLNTVTALGEGTHVAAPDRAEMTFGVTTQGSEAKATLDDASKRSDTLIAALKKAGINADDIQTSGVSLNPQYDYNEGKLPRITGYQASLQVRVTMKDIEKIGDIIAAGSDGGATDIQGPNWTLSEDSDARAQAIEKAVANATVRAEVMAKAAGKSLGEVVSLNESGVSVPVIYGATRGAADMAATVPQIEPGTLDITANVTVVFELK